MPENCSSYNRVVPENCSSDNRVVTVGLELDRSYFGERRWGEERSNREEGSAGFYEKKCATAGRNVKKEETRGKIKWREGLGFNLNVTVDRKDELFRVLEISMVKRIKTPHWDIHILYWSIRHCSWIFDWKLLNLAYFYRARMWNVKSLWWNLNYGIEWKCNAWFSVTEM